MKYARIEFCAGLWFKQQSSTHIIYARRIGSTKTRNGFADGNDVVLAITICDGSFSRPRIDTMHSWYPIAKPIEEKCVPEKILNLINKRLAKIDDENRIHDSPLSFATTLLKRKS